MGLSRRMFFKRSGAVAAAAVAPAAMEAAVRDVPRGFPSGFVWGSATSAYQVEGAVREDGRGESIWDRYSHTPGRIFNGDNGDVAADFYHRYKDDIALMKRLGLKACRFSVSWPRIFPQGVGKPNPKGLDFYKRLVDEMLRAGIEPYCTLFHWDLPQVLEDRGGWTSMDTARAFANYAGYVTAALSDRVKLWMTINEFHSFIDLAYGPNPVMAPGRVVSRAQLAQARHHALLAHGLGMQAIRASAKGKLRVGLADDVQGVMPVLETPEHIAAAERALRVQNGSYTTALMEGKYPREYLDSLAGDVPRFTPEEMKVISSPMDFFGVNIYTTNPVAAADTPLGYRMVARPKSFPHAVSTWLYVSPEALYWTPKLMNKVWGVKEMYITENGCSCDDVVNERGEVMDTDRVTYLRSYLMQLQRGVSEGVPVKGYFVWSLLDNFEWGKGYSERFGITYVDFRTQRRTPKLSAEFLRQTIAKNAIS